MLLVPLEYVKVVCSSKRKRVLTTALPPPTTPSATWATALSPSFTLPPPPLDRIEAACAFATERGGVLVPLLTLLTLRHSHCASIESKWQAVQRRSHSCLLPLPSGAPPSPLIKLRQRAAWWGAAVLTPLRTSLLPLPLLGTMQRVA